MSTLADITEMSAYGDFMETVNTRTLRLLGTTVRRLRKEHALTQAQLAETAGVSRAWIIELEKGTRANAEWSTISAVLDALDANLAVQFERESPRR